MIKERLIKVKCELCGREFYKLPEDIKECEICKKKICDECIGEYDEHFEVYICVECVKDMYD